ncbi:MAG: CAP domain-containing protein [Solirubrobacteraceae bacterium]
MARARSKTLLAFTACLCAIAAIALALGGAIVGTTPAFADGSCANANLTPTSGNVEQVRAAVLCLINQEREHHGEGALTPNAKLTRAAQAHSRDMANEDYFSHTAPNGETPLQRVRASGYLPNSQDGYVVGENIAWGTMWLATPQSIVSAWMASPGHRANILDGAYRETGIGVEPRPPASLAEGQPGALYTQDFGTIIPAGHSSRHVAGGSAGSSSASGDGHTHRAHHRHKHRHHRHRRRHHRHRRHKRSRHRS